MKTLLTIATLIALAFTAQAGDRHRKHRHSESRDYIIRRQEAYQVEGPPTDRLIIGRRQIDGYRQGNETIWYEGDNVTGVTHDDE